MPGDALELERRLLRGLCRLRLAPLDVVQPLPEPALAARQVDDPRLERLLALHDALLEAQHLVAPRLQALQFPRVEHRHRGSGVVRPLGGRVHRCHRSRGHERRSE